MLQEIYINNFVLIDELRLELLPGLNVLTGETGAGKSIIIDAIGLIIGERIKNDFIKDDSRRAVVEAVFDVSDSADACIFLRENGLLEEDENQVIMSREIASNGRNTARVNGHPVTVAILRNLAAFLLDMHLQHDHLSILRPDRYLAYVDNFSAGSHELLSSLKETYSNMKIKKKELAALNLDEKEKQQKLDFLNYQIQEIENAHLKPGEEEELSSLLTRIKNSRLLIEGCSRILESLYEGREQYNAYDLISTAADTCREMGEDEFFQNLREQLEEMDYILQDRASAISKYRDALDFDPGLQEEIEDRLYLVSKLKGKYGKTIDEVLCFMETAQKEKEQLDHSQAAQAVLEKEIESRQQIYLAQAGDLRELRKEGAAIMQSKVHRELAELNMPDIQFEIVLESLELETETGMDKVDFLFSANPGEELRSLSRIASGGEISRFVLALKKALAEIYAVPTLIFDEIDVGVGGSSLTAMAGKLKELAASHQVILVTHSPLVASYADQHYLIQKRIEKGKTSTAVKELAVEDRIQEIARMLAGDDFSDLTYEHAREMYQRGHEK